MRRINFNLGHKLNMLIYLVAKARRDDVFALSSQLAYYLVLSFFPFMLFIMTLLGFSQLNSAEILQGLNVLLPKSIMELINSTVKDIFDNQHTGLLGLSILLMVWTSSSAFKSIIKGVNKAYNFKEDRSFFKLSAISMLGILGLAFIIILALTVLVFGNVISSYIKNTNEFYQLQLIFWNIFRYAFILIFMIFVFAAIYKIAPSKKVKFKSVIPGSVFSTIGWVVVSVGFSYYIDNFNNYSRFYGSLGAVFILITWLYLISIITILGVEINFVISESKK